MGTNTDPKLNPSCSDAVTDGGWYECPTPLTGDIISIQRTTGSNNYFNVLALRAYEGINVAKSATVYAEPTHAAGEGASNLL